MIVNRFICTATLLPERCNLDSPPCQDTALPQNLTVSCKDSLRGRWSARSSTILPCACYILPSRCFCWLLSCVYLPTKIQWNKKRNTGQISHSQPITQNKRLTDTEEYGAFEEAPLLAEKLRRRQELPLSQYGISGLIQQPHCPLYQANVSYHELLQTWLFQILESCLLIKRCL